MKMTPIGRRCLAGREGERLTSYRCSAGVWTVGVGHTAACGAPIPGPGVRITAAQSDAAFERDLVKFETAVAGALKVPVADHEFDALVSLAFNVGGRGVARSTIVRKLNAGDRAGAADAFLMWRIPAEILSRRRAERLQFKTPYAKALPRARDTDKRPAKTVPLSLPKPARPAPAPAASSGGFFVFLGRLFGRS